MRTRHITLVPARANVTDRALRYRANSEPPEGPKRCCMCGGRQNVEVEHIDGREENNQPENKMWACRSCNTKKGMLFARLGIGRRTAQYNPAGGAKSLGQWMLAVLSAKGESDAMSVRDAVAMIRDTPQSRRSRFAEEIWEKRRAHGTDRSEVPF
jgi:hypothetical protein